MFIKNYTSDVPVHQTIHRIEQVLIKCGVSGIMKEYGPNSEVIAITFKIEFEKGKSVSIRLPADRDAAWNALWLDYVDGDKTDGQIILWNSRKRKTKAQFKEQAERTAWKLVQDWVEVQMSMIQMKQADFVQVFLPYVWDGRQTYWQAVKDSGYKGLLLPENV
jgi:hypothetical protein